MRKYLNQSFKHYKNISHHLLSIFWQSRHKSLLLAACLHSVQNTEKCVRILINLQICVPLLCLEQLR